MKAAFVLVCLLAVWAPLSGHCAETLECRYFSVELPDDWQAVSPPDENAAISLTNAHFAKRGGSTSVAIIVAPTGNLDAKTIAETFAQQYNAAKGPAENNGQYTFAFKQLGANCQAWVTTQDDVFMFTAILGNQREGMAFVRKYVKSADYAKLLPR